MGDDGSVGCILGLCAYETGEGEFEEEEICGALVAPDFAQGESAWFVAVAFSDVGWEGRCVYFILSIRILRIPSFMG